MERRLAAILAADVMGYSRHTERNEEASTTTLRECRAVVEAAIAAHKGHIFSSAGDGLVAEFPSIVKAIRCAVEIQNEIATRNTSVPNDERMQFRIGVNLGDVIVEDNNLYGSGVNVAVRLEQMAEPGGICISQTVYDQVRKIIEIPFEDIGERRLKNIADPVHVYRILPTPLPWYKKLWPRAGIYLRGSTVAALICLLIFGVAAGVSYYLRAPAALWSSLLSDLSAFKPKSVGIAVLPFESIGDNPEGKDFARALTGDILTELSRRRDLRVIRFRGETADTGNIASAPKVDYKLEGTVRPSGDELIRVSPTLLKVDGQADQVMWGHNFDRKITDRFNVDDEIVCHIVANITGGYGAIESRQAEWAKQKSPEQRRADDLVSQATAAMQYEWTKENFDNARKLLRDALILDLNSGPARRELAFYDLMSAVFEFDDPPVSLQDIAKDASDLLKLEPHDGRARMVVAATHFFSEERETEEHKIEEVKRFDDEASKAIADAPCDPQVLAILGALLANSGKWARGVSLVKRANALNSTAALGWYHSTMYLNYYLNGGQYQRALNMMRYSPDFPKRENLESGNDPVPYAIYDYIAICGQLGSKKHTKCAYKTEELSAEEAWRWLAKADCKWIGAEWDDSSNTCPKKGKYASRESIENWYKGWNFRKGDILKLMEGVDASGVLGIEAGVQPVVDHHPELSVER